MMNLNHKARGLTALLGRAPAVDFDLYFGPPRRAFKISWAVVGGSLLLFLIFASNFAALRQRAAAPLEAALGKSDDIDGAVHSLLAAWPFGAGFSLYLLSFTAFAYVLGYVFQKREYFYQWAALRHWMVFLALIPLSVFAGLARFGILPIMLVNITAFIFYVGWLFADIRLADKFGRIGVMGSVFAACLIHALGLLITLALVVQLLF